MGKIVVPGALPFFNNEENGRWSGRPNTILVDSEQLESGEGMTPEFKKIAGVEIEEFKAEYRQRFPGRSADDLSDEDLLREVMNTVGKPGKLRARPMCRIGLNADGRLGCQHRHPRSGRAGVRNPAFV